MKKLAYSLTISLSLLISGCSLHQSMPRTIIGFNPATKALSIESPKDVEINGFALTYATNGQVSITWSNYVSKQNASVVNAVAAYNKAMQDAALKAGEQVLSTVAGLAK